MKTAKKKVSKKKVAAKSPKKTTGKTSVESQGEEKAKSFAEERAKKKLEVRGKINKQFGENSSGSAGASMARYIPRISTGCFDIDMAMGGGWPRGRINMVWGEQSGGKTTTLVRTLADAQRRDTITNRYIEHMPPDQQKDAVPMSCAWVDVEGTFDRRWVQKHGVDLDNLEYSRPMSQEEACSLIEAYCLSGAYDAIFIDSLAAMASEKEVEGDMGAHNVGVTARNNNQMFRKVQSSLNRLSKEGQPIPTLFFINQVRSKIGVMFGSPDTKPGGKGQDFFTSVTLFLSGQKMHYYDEKERKFPKLVEMSFRIDKNKTHPPKINGKIQQALVDDPSGFFEAGDIIEAKGVMELAEKVGIYKVEPKGWSMFGKHYKRKMDLAEEWVSHRGNFKILKGVLMTQLFPHQAQDWEVSIVQPEEETAREEELVLGHEEDQKGGAQLQDK